MSRLYLSAPDLSGKELDLLRDALASGWIAPLGPHVDAFERELADRVGMPHALACSSGTAALHLALLALGIGAGDVVWTSTLTFAATANAIRYVNARPVFIDSDRSSWNIDPALVVEALAAAERRGTLPKALIIVDLYGQCADADPIMEACRARGVAVIEDAAEALGATYKDHHAGALGDLSIFSFNGNKIITTSGGGMLLARRRDVVERARYLATQARQPVVHYEHTDIGFNYRLSNLLAAVGRAQLADLERRVQRRRAIRDFYRTRLAQRGWEFMPEASFGRATFWLTCALTSSAEERDAVLARLTAADIEARPLWKPMHMQPVFAQYPRVGGGVAEDLFARGLCLPSGSGLTDHDLARVVDAIGSV